MPLPSSGAHNLTAALAGVLGLADNIKTRAAASLLILQSGSVNSDWVFMFLDQVNSIKGAFDLYRATAGLDNFANAQIPGYAGTITTDAAATIAAMQACIDWVVANFPKDSTDTFILSHQLAADGTRITRTFSTAQTLGLRTALQNLIATVG